MSWFKSNEAIVVDFREKKVIAKKKLLTEVESEFEVVVIKKIEYPAFSKVEEEEVNVSALNNGNIPK